MTQRRCQECGHFYPKRDAACPECLAPKYPVNSWLVHARMNSALWSQTERVVRDG